MAEVVIVARDEVSLMAVATVATYVGPPVVVVVGLCIVVCVLLW